MIPSETKDRKILTDEERIEILKGKIEIINKPKEWAGDLEISALAFMLNVKIILYIKDNFYYKKYFEFVNEEEPINEIKILFEASNHFNLLIQN